MVKLLGHLTLFCVFQRTPKVDLIPINTKDRLSQVTLINGIKIYSVVLSFSFSSIITHTEDDEVYTTESTDVSEAEIVLVCDNGQVLISPGWSNTRYLSSIRTTLEIMPQEESELG
ncbi:hypothetical protein ACTFIR_009449 [Dictyostelium discoideum]